MNKEVVRLVIYYCNDPVVSIQLASTCKLFYRTFRPLIMSLYTVKTYDKDIDYTFYRINGKLHRENGKPAIIDSLKGHLYYINDKKLLLRRMTFIQN